MLQKRSAKVQNGGMIDWNDLRYFLAVAETGSTLAAGRALRTSQTTVARRIAALEQATELALFERRQAGYRLTPAGEALLARARAVQDAADGFAEAAASQSRDVEGTVRLTCEEILAVTVLPPILRDLHDAFPAIRIELDPADEHRDLGAGQADVALRSAKQLEGGGLVARRIGDNPWTLYCSRAYAAAHGVPHSLRDLPGHALIGGGGEGVWQAYRAWLEAHGLEGAVTMQYGSVTGLLAAVRAGSGLTVLPGFVADQDPDLIRCLPPLEEHRPSLWLLTHERLRHTPRIRAVMDFLADRLTQLARAATAAEAA